MAPDDINSIKHLKVKGVRMTILIPYLVYNKLHIRRYGKLPNQRPGTICDVPWRYFGRLENLTLMPTTKTHMLRDVEPRHRKESEEDIQLFFRLEKEQDPQRSIPMVVV